MRKKLSYTVLTLAMAGGLAVSSAGAASAGHAYNVQTGNGCQTTSASATANDNEKEQSGNSAAGQSRAAKRSPAISEGGC